MSTLSELVGSGEAAPWHKEPKVASDYIAGRYYLPSIAFTGDSGISIAADYIIYMPFIPNRPHTFDRIAIVNTDTAASGNKCRLGIYADDGTGRPGNLVIDVGEITFGATAILNQLTISQALTANTIYWLAIVFDTATDVLCGYYSSAAGLKWPAQPMLFTYGFDADQFAASSFFSALRESHSYAALPATATPIAGTANQLPLISLRG